MTWALDARTANLVLPLGREQGGGEVQVGACEECTFEIDRESIMVASNAEWTGTCLDSPVLSVASVVPSKGTSGIVDSSYVRDDLLLLYGDLERGRRHGSWWWWSPVLPIAREVVYDHGVRVRTSDWQYRTRIVGGAYQAMPPVGPCPVGTHPQGLVDREHAAEWCENDAGHEEARHALWWLTSGRVAAYREVRDDVSNGLYSSWYENGMRSSEVHWYDGKKHGMEYDWSDQGVLRKRVLWEMDTPIVELASSSDEGTRPFWRDDSSGAYVAWHASGGVQRVCMPLSTSADVIGCASFDESGVLSEVHQERSYGLDGPAIALWPSGDVREAGRNQSRGRVGVWTSWSEDGLVGTSIDHGSGGAGTPTGGQASKPTPAEIQHVAPTAIEAVKRGKLPAPSPSEPSVNDAIAPPEIVSQMTADRHDVRPHELLVSMDSHDYQYADLQCPNGVRERRPLADGHAVFEGLPYGVDCGFAPRGGDAIEPTTVRAGKAYTCRVQDWVVTCDVLP